MSDVFFEQKLSEKLVFFGQFFDYQLPVFAISAHFLKSDLHRGQPLAKFTPGNSIWHVCTHFWFPSYFEKVFINHYLSTLHIDRSFVSIVIVVNVPQNSLANKKNHSRKPARVCCGAYVGFFDRKSLKNWLALSLLQALIIKLDRSYKIIGYAIYVNSLFYIWAKKSHSLLHSLA